MISPILRPVITPKQNIRYRRCHIQSPLAYSLMASCSLMIVFQSRIGSTFYTRSPPPECTLYEI